MEKVSIFKNIENASNIQMCLMHMLNDKESLSVVLRLDKGNKVNIIQMTQGLKSKLKNYADLVKRIPTSVIVGEEGTVLYITFYQDLRYKRCKCYVNNSNLYSDIYEVLIKFDNNDRRFGLKPKNKQKVNALINSRYVIKSRTNKIQDDLYNINQLLSHLYVKNKGKSIEDFSEYINIQSNDTKMVLELNELLFLLVYSLNGKVPTSISYTDTMLYIMILVKYAHKVLYKDVMNYYQPEDDVLITAPCKLIAQELYKDEFGELDTSLNWDVISMYTVVHATVLVGIGGYSEVHAFQLLDGKTENIIGNIEYYLKP